MFFVGVVIVVSFCFFSTGYCSDTENSTQECREQSNLLGIEAQSQVSKAGILATPVLSRPQFLRKTSANEKEKRKGQDKSMQIKCSLTRKSKEKEKRKSDTDEQNPNFDSNLIRPLHTKKCQERRKHGVNLVSCKREKGESSHRVDPKCVQSNQPDWYSSSDVSASDSFVGFYLSKKSTEENDSSKVGNRECETSNSKGRAIKHFGSIEMERQSSPNLSGSDSFSTEPFGAHEARSLQTFASTIVRKICEVAFSRCVKETTKDIAIKFVAELVLKAKNKLVQKETVNCCYEDLNGNMGQEEVKSPSFSKVWKYSRSFPTEISFESLKINDSLLLDKDSDMCSRSKEDADIESKNDSQFEEFLERTLLDSLESSYEGGSMQSGSHSSDELNELKSQNKGGDFILEKGHEYHSSDKELSRHHSLVNTENNIQRSNDVSSGFGIHMATYEQAVHGRDENLALINQKLKLEGSRALHGNSREKANKNKTQTDVKMSPHRTPSEDCNDFNPKDSEEDPNVSSNTFGSVVSYVDLTNTGRLIADEKSSFGNEPSFLRRFLYKRTVSESQASERKHWTPLETQERNLRSSHSSTLSCNTITKQFRSSSCPVVSEVSDFSK